MADKTTELERIYTIPLRRAHMGTRSKRADRAIRDVRSFLQRHMKSEHIWISGDVNEHIWARGKFRIPSRVRVRAMRFDDGVVEVTLPDEEAIGSVREAIAERQEKAAETPVLAGMAEELSEAEAESVTAIAGIGPAMAEKLEKIEIESVADLAAASPAAVAEAVGRDEEAVTAWIESARAMVAEAEEGVEEGSEGEQSVEATTEVGEPVELAGEPSDSEE